MKDMKKRMEPFENCFALEFTKPKFNCCGVQQLSKSGKWTKYYSRNSDFSHFGCESRREESQTKAKKKKTQKHTPLSIVVAWSAAELRSASKAPRASAHRWARCADSWASRACRCHPCSAATVLCRLQTLLALGEPSYCTVCNRMGFSAGDFRTTIEFC